MEVSFSIPDDIATLLTSEGADVSRRALEAFAVEELRAGRITEPELGKILGLGRIERDGFLKARGIFQKYTVEDFEREREALRSLGFYDSVAGGGAD